MSYRITRRGINAGIGAALISPALRRRPLSRKARADQDRLQHGADRSARAERQTGAARRSDLARASQRQGRSARPQGRARSTTTISPIRRTFPASTPSCSTSTKSTSSSRAMRPTWWRRPFRSSCRRARSSSACSRSTPTASSTIRNISRCCRPARHRKASFTEGFFQVAAAQNPKPQTVALASEDAEFARNACDGARENAKKYELQDRLRQDLPAGHDGFLADHPRAAGRPMPDLVVVVLLSAELGRHRAVRQRARFQAEDDRRRHGRPAGDRVQGQAEVEAQRHRQLRNLGAVAETDGAGRGLLQEIPGRAPRLQASIRSAIISAAGATPISRCCGRPSRAPRASTTTSSPTICAAMSSTPSWRDIRFGKNGEWTKSGHAAGAVSRHHRRREPRDLARHELSDRAHAGRRRPAK